MTWGLTAILIYDKMEVRCGQLNNMKNRQTTLQQLDKVLELHRIGLSLREIKKLVGLSHQTIANLIMKYKKVDKK